METAIHYASTEIESIPDEIHRTLSEPPPPKNEPGLLNENQENTSSDHENKAKKLQKLMEDDLQLIDDASKNLQKYRAEVERQQDRAKEKLLKFNEISERHLFLLEKDIMKLKTEIPSKVKVRYSDTAATDAKPKEKFPSLLIMSEKNKEYLAEVPSLYNKDMFKSSEIFKEFEASFNLLELHHKLCLLCFSAFPENATIKKRLLMYWWIGEGFIPSGEKAKAAAKEVVKELIAKNFIQPVYDKCPFKKKAHSYNLQTLAHAAVVMLAEREKFFDFDESGNPTKQHGRSLRACLVPQKDKKLEKDGSLKRSVNTQTSHKPMAHVVFNLKETILRLNPEWFTEMKLANILYLGKWDSTRKHHIEVEEPDVLDGKKEKPNVLEGLADLKYVKFLSLQGISGITEIPDSVSKLWNLRVLDLRACHSLEVIPQGIGSLHNLTHLDISECYLLSRMPKGLKELRNLVVFKGFEVEDSKDKYSCTLEDLLTMTKLSKLSIHTEIKEFPRATDLKVLKNFLELRILTIEWGGNSFRHSDSTEPEMRGTSAKSKARSGRNAINKKSFHRSNAFKKPELSLPINLEKLDLKCFPRRSAVTCVELESRELMHLTWLKPSNLKELKKLYIRGGELRDLGQLGYWGDSERNTRTEPEVWNVERLRLKYLAELEMDWMELHELFPNVKYLEKVKCPKLTMFPCNAYGVWKDKKGTLVQEAFRDLAGSRGVSYPQGV